MDSRDGITTAPNAMKEDKEYYVCANFQEKIIKAVDSSQRKSDRLNSEAATPMNFNNTTLTVVFADKENDVQEEHYI